MNALQQDSTRFAILQQNMQMQHKDIAPECEMLNLPENYEQFVEGIHRANPYNVESSYDNRSAQTSPKSGRKKQLKVSCLVNKTKGTSSLANVSFKMFAYYSNYLLK